MGNAGTRSKRGMLARLIILGGLAEGIYAPSLARGEDPETISILLTARSEQGRARVSESPLILRAEVARGARAPSPEVVSWVGVSDAALDAGVAIPPGGIRLRGVSPGRYQLPLISGEQTIVVADVVGRTRAGAAVDSVALARALPPELSLGDESDDQEEATTFLVEGPTEHLPLVVSLVSQGSGGEFTDSLRNVPLQAVRCPSRSGSSPRQPGISCASTPPIRVAVDLIDRNHPAIAHRTIVGEVGGWLDLRLGRDAQLRLPILAPAKLEKGGPGRYRAKIRARVLRTFAGGPPAVGSDEAEARKIVRDEIASASRMWGQCGIHLGPSRDLDIQVVDPPEISMLTVGCGRGLPASGGEIRLVLAGRKLSLRTSPGQTPRVVAGRLAAAAQKLGIEAAVFRNVRAEGSALGGVDVVFTDRRGKPVSVVSAPSGISSDPTLGVCEAELDLADGLAHFDDLDAATGTIEERYLLRALSDDDPATIELIVVPVFGGVGRIGESFIPIRGGSIDSALILDRTGIRAGARSFTLAHELGHILLDLPGHPDDFGVDTPSSLMDADAADATIFGPRRLTLDDCKRALRQSGRGAPQPLIFDWPMATD